jgi:aminoacrylate hydrolase
MPHVRAGEVEVYWERHGEGEPVLLVQGLGANHRFWAPLLPIFTSRAQVILADWPGTGLSGDFSPQTEVSTANLADALVAVLDAAGAERAHVVGRSMGGCIAQQIAIRHPARTRSLVLASTWARADPFLAAVLSSWPEILEAGGDALLLSQASFWAFPREFYSPEYRREEREVADVIAHAIEIPQRPKEFKRLAAAGVEHDSVPHLHSITAPTTVAVGDDDILTPPFLARPLYQLIPGARLARIEGAGHGFYEQLPRKFADLVFDTWSRASLGV